MEAQAKKLSWEERPLVELLRLSWPIAVSTLSYSVMTMVDTLLVGHLGPAPLAGVGLGGMAAFALLCFSFGLFRGVKTLVSQAVGAGRNDLVSAYRGTALLCAAIIGASTIVVGQLTASLMLRLAASADAGEAARLYLVIRNLAAPMALCTVVLRECSYGEGDARSPMLATVVANVGNIALACLLVFALHRGVAGAAAATVVAQALECGVLAWLGRRRGWRYNGGTLRHMRELWRIGAPTAVQFTLEVGAFVILAVLISSLSEVQMAAHQIALQVCQFSFLPAYAVSEAASVMAGQAVGARRRELVLPVAWLGLAVAGGYTLACSLLFATSGHAIARGFTSNGALATVAVRLLYVAALFQAFDGANMVARGVLRYGRSMTFARLLLLVVALPFAAHAAADEAACQQLRERGYEACYHQNDMARADCAGECARCGAELSGCIAYCDHFCDAPLPEGCNFDLNACVSRCNHHCHEPACDGNAGCKQAWCAPATVKQCSDTCQATWNALASCRASWCSDGKSRGACVASCNAGKAPADACRKAWCGDGKSGARCYRDADAAEEQCRKEVDASVKACMAKK
jgi:MATE family multidrug resistance protein